MKLNMVVGCVLTSAGLFAGCQHVQQTLDAATPQATASSTTIAPAAAGRREVAELMPGTPVGYLQVGERPDSLKLLHPPPAPGSAALAYDEETRRHAVSMRESPRWKLARQDADLHPDQVFETFECALGVAIDPQQTPRLFQMLQRVAVDAGYSTYGVKNKYQRARPFVVHPDPQCTPEEDAELRTDGSYPSGHSALGWAVSLVLAETAPERTNELVARGISFGESRVVCNVHWQSDVIAGRTMGTATFARLQSVPDFTEDVAIARTEISRARGLGLRPSRDCDAEAAALAQALQGAQ